MSLYNIPIEKLYGVGAKRARLFEKLGVCSVGELITFYPRTYDDWTEVSEILDASDGETVCVRAKISAPFHSGYTRTSKFIAKTVAYDESGGMELVFFNNRYISSMLKYGETYYFRGKINRDLDGIRMVSPSFSSEAEGAGIAPVYSLTAGLNNNAVVKAVKQALKMLPEKVNDPIPPEILEKYNLCGLKFALDNIHFPKDRASLETARKRLVVEELLALDLGLRGLKAHKRAENKNIIRTDYSDSFAKLLPYRLTGAQKRVIADCVEDMRSPERSLNRLVQGDVGSGKTVVAASLCYTVTNNGMQSAFMVPTEILAEQHYNSLSEIFKDTGVRIALLTGSVKQSEKDRIREELAEGEIDLVIGTHALITDATQFKRLGLVVTDEQHRFGVSQRSKLLSKGESPHLLVMSATPIPRTLGLIIFGDLDISVIDELPPGRQVIDTLLINSSKRDRALGFIRKQVGEGRQAYIVCPLVEEGETDLASAEEYAAELMLNHFSDIPIGILHGKLKPSEKESVMLDFAENRVKILVATTVIEVGVDVPNATIMMIENAERFGLSQLHQLRGRVGRGKFKSYCILVSDSSAQTSYERLKIMCTTRDGFKIADADLKLRGPGDFFGSRQHGLPQLKISSLADTKNLELSREIADHISADGLYNDRYRGIKSEINRIFSSIDDSTLN